MDRHHAETEPGTAAAGSRETICPTCRTPFVCSAQAGDESACWCSAMPPLTSLKAGQDCLCPRCLREAVAGQAAV